MLKYKIADILNDLPMKDHDTKKAELISKLGVSRSTFNDWLKLKTSDRRDIGGMHLVVIAEFFNCDLQDLINFENSAKPVKNTTGDKAKKILRSQKILVPKK